MEWDIKDVLNETVWDQTDQKKFDSKYKDPDILPKVNKADMVERMVAIKEYLRSCHSVKEFLLKYFENDGDGAKVW